MNIESRKKREPAVFPGITREKRAALSHLQSCLGTLDPEDRLIVHLRFWECMSIEQIAQSLRKTWEQVDHQINRILFHLKAEIILHLRSSDPQNMSG